MGERRSNVPESLDLLFRSDVQIDRTGRLWMTLSPGLAFRLPGSGAAGRVGGLYLVVERLPCRSGDGGLTAKGVEGPA